MCGGGGQFGDELVQFIHISLGNRRRAFGLVVGHRDGNDSALAVFRHNRILRERFARIFFEFGSIELLELKPFDEPVLHGAAAQNAHKQRARTLDSQQISCPSTQTVPAPRRKCGHDRQARTRLRVRRHQLCRGLVFNRQSECQEPANHHPSQNGSREKTSLVPQNAQSLNQTIAKDRPVQFRRLTPLEKGLAWSLNLWFCSCL